MLEAEVLPQSSVDDFDSHGDKSPAFVADVSFIATGTDLVVICQIEIEDELLCEGTEGGRFAESFAVARIGCVDRADFEAGRVELEDLFAESEEELRLARRAG